MTIIDEIQAKLPEGTTLSERTQERLKTMKLEHDRYERTVEVDSEKMTVSFGANGQVYTTYTIRL